MKRPRLLSVAEVAAELDASEAYVRRLLLRQRLYGTKLGFVWVIYPDDLEAFKLLRACETVALSRSNTETMDDPSAA